MFDPTPDPLTPGESELESALARLVPQVAFDRREAIAYEAGRRAGRRAAVPWRVCTGALAACLLVAIFPRATPPPPSLLVTAPPSPTAPPTHVVAMTPEEVRPAAGTYLAVRDEVLAKGLDALPAGTGGGGSADLRPVPRAVQIHDSSVHLPSLFGGRS
jgi:hypothetical protein